MTLAQLINILYNIVDRMYIGRIPEHATLSLTGLGLSMPIITVVIAFANLFGMGARRFAPSQEARGILRARKNCRQRLYHAFVHRAAAHHHRAAV